MAIGNVELLHQCFPNNNEIRQREEEGKKWGVSIEIKK